MPSPWLTQVDSSEMGNVPDIEQFIIHRLMVKQGYNLLMAMAPPNKSKVAWEMNLEIPISNDTWKSVCLRYKQFTSKRLASMYLKLVHRCYNLNARIAKWNRTYSPLCTFCGDKEETWVHLFWECERVSSIWTQCQVWCKHFIDSMTPLSKNACLILGFKEPIFNTIVTLVKRTILLARL